MHIESGGISIMTAPIVSVLPTAPSILSRPTLFISESTVFLDTLPVYRTEMNNLSSYVNFTIVSKYNYGTLNGKRDFPDISQSLLLDVEYVGDSVVFASDVEAIYFTIQKQSEKADLIGAWLDAVVTEVGVVPYDTDKPLVSGVTSPMYRGQTQSDFNTDSFNFSESAIENINSMYQAIWYTYNIACGNDSNGNITDSTIIHFEDCGSISDTTITY